MSASFADRMASRFSDEVKNHFGYWRKTAPSCPLSASGSRPSANSRQTSASSSPGRSLAYRRGFSARVAGSASRRPFGSRFVSVGWPVSRAWALMSNTKSGGVRSTHSSDSRRDGSA